MFGSLLIANRGEIAVRIARTARALGLRTVGVYSEADRNALHVDAVDVAVHIGGAAPADSYLRIDAIVAAAVATGADAIHPGYGFLSERADFAQAVIDAGLVWVGPRPEQIALLGDKVRAKATAVAAGVPTTPVIECPPGEVPPDVPFPALVKAAAGGGGRGMRVVGSPDELPAALEAARREAAAAFGDGAVFIEPYIAAGRHIEVQVLGDTHGHVVHLGERECSIQRRNQKIVEEAPSAGIADDTRTAVCDGAVALARHVGYHNAGTVEYLVADDGAITFLEVNTRLQVEHPVTEAVTGLDLVELQLRIAAGEALPFTQDDIAVDGHAIEVRLVAEDPSAGWLPSTGTLGSFAVPGPVRIDAGFRDGDEVTPFYDSLLAKVIAHGSDRTTAASVLARSLDGAACTGIRSNAAHAAALLRSPDFLAAATPTSFLHDHPELAAPTPIDVVGLIGAVVAAERIRRAADSVTGFAPSGWRNLRTQGVRERWSSSSGDVEVEYTVDGAAMTILVGEWPRPTDDGSLGADDRAAHHVRVLRSDADALALELDGVRHVVGTAVSDDGTSVVVSGPARTEAWQTVPRFVVPYAAAAGVGPVSPLPGTVIAVHVSAGDSVEEGQILVVVEAMKMEHAIVAGAPGRIASLPFGVGARVDAGDLLVEFDDES